MGASLDGLFPDDRFRTNGKLIIRNLPYLVRPIIESIHDMQPDIVIAGDRGARLFAYTALQSWHKRYPGEKFPSRSGGIIFARVTSRSAEYEDVRDAVGYAIKHSGPKGALVHLDKKTAAGLSVMYLDDWAVYGDTIDRFVDGASGLGIPTRNITYATLCGNKMDSVRHVIGDPERNPRRSEWDSEGGSELYVGMRYNWNQPTVPITNMNPEAHMARRQIGRDIDEYYAGFSAVMSAGQIPPTVAA